MDSKKPDNGTGMELAESDKPDVPATETQGRDRTANLFERLWLASNMIGAMTKDGKVTGGGNYKFMSHDNVTARAKEAFAKVGVYHCATMTDVSQTGNRTTCKADLLFINIDAPEDRMVLSSAGQGVDNQDKGVGKAYSYAVKYGLMKALMLNTDEDIESHNLEFDDGQSSKVEAAKIETQEALMAWAETFKVALKTAQSLEDVKKLEKSNKPQLSSADMPSVTRGFFIDLIETRKQELYNE